jgi:hypothetical protein
VSWLKGLVSSNKSILLLWIPIKDRSEGGGSCILRLNLTAVACYSLGKSSEFLMLAVLESKLKKSLVRLVVKRKTEPWRSTPLFVLSVLIEAPEGSLVRSIAGRLEWMSVLVNRKESNRRKKSKLLFLWAFYLSSTRRFILSLMGCRISVVVR